MFRVVRELLLGPSVEYKSTNECDSRRPNPFFLNLDHHIQRTQASISETGEVVIKKSGPLNLYELGHDYHHAIFADTHDFNYIQLFLEVDNYRVARNHEIRVHFKNEQGFNKLQQALERSGFAPNCFNTYHKYENQSYLVCIRLGSRQNLDRFYNVFKSLYGEVIGLENHLRNCLKALLSTPDLPNWLVQKGVKIYGFPSRNYNHSICSRLNLNGIVESIEVESPKRAIFTLRCSDEISAELKAKFAAIDFKGLKGTKVDLSELHLPSTDAKFTTATKALEILCFMDKSLVEALRGIASSHSGIYRVIEKWSSSSEAFMAGFHSRIGQESPINTVLNADPVFERKLLPLVFNYLNPLFIAPDTTNRNDELAPIIKRLSKL